jgi:hypothetical protein
MMEPHKACRQMNTLVLMGMQPRMTMRIEVGKWVKIIVN